MGHKNRFKPRGYFGMWERTSHKPSRYQSPRSIEPPWDPLAARLREMLQVSRKTIYQLSADTGIDGAYIWRIVRSERQEVSREVLVLLSISLVLDKLLADQVVEMANELLDAGGYKKLRAPKDREA